MATQLAAPEGGEGTIIPGEVQDNEPEVRDYHAEAIEMGWRPLEEWPGQPEKHIDEKTFVERSETMLPLLKRQAKAYRTELAGLKKDIKRATEHFSKSEERAYARALADLQERQDSAAEVGDVAGVRKAREEIAGLKSDVTKAAPDEDLHLVAREAEIDWREKNPWYDKGGLMKDYADTQVEKFGHLAKDMAPADFFDMISDKVKARFGAERMPDEPPAHRAINPVEGGGTNRRAAGGKGWADMSPEERRVGQAMAARWVKSGLLATADDYLKDYDFGGKK